MASITACSLHPMDVRLLRQFISAVQGGPIPDFTVEVARRAHRDMLLNWSCKIVKAAAPLTAAVSSDKWTLYTQLRPFFITTDNPEQAASIAERFFNVTTEDDIVNLFREEVARIDADRADDIITVALRDQTPGPLAHFSADEISTHLRAYLLYQRRQLESLTTAAASGNVSTSQLATAGRLLAWRTCNLLANMHPTWQTRATSLTALASRKELELESLVADPRGMYAAIAQRIPGLHDQIPYHLSDDRQTGLCITPQSVAFVLDDISIWPSPIPYDSTLGAPSSVEIQALKEALLYARLHQAGIWEAAGMVNLTEGVYPQILADQGEREEKEFAPPAVEPVVTAAPVAPAAAAPVVAGPVVDAPAPAAIPAAEDAYLRKWQETTPVEQTAAEEEATADEPKKPWFKTMFKKK